MVRISLLHMCVVPVSVAVYPEVTVHRTNTKSTINCTSSGVPAPFVEFINSTCQKDQMGEAEEGMYAHAITIINLNSVITSHLLLFRSKQ